MVSIIKEPQPTKAKQFHGGERPKNDDDDAITVKKCIEYNFPPSSYRSDRGNKLKNLWFPETVLVPEAIKLMMINPEHCNGATLILVPTRFENGRAEKLP